nr:MAG: ADP-ribosyltransferase [Bacteriophage sp.]
MSIICPNLKNEEVAREFEELKNATSEAAAYHIWSLNNGNSIDKAPNGEPSKLFSDLLEHYNGDRVAAIQAKARTYSESFKDWFGDWVNPLKPGDIVFGHPAIGKTYSLESGKYKDKIIDWDVEFNEKRDKWIEDHSNTVKGTPEYKKARNEYLIYPENHPDYVEFLTEEWERVKSKTKKEGKILFASPHNLLKMFPQDFDRIINLKDEDFVKRNIERGGKERESKLWKEGINNTILNITNIPIEYLNENQHFEDYLNKYIGVSKVVDENGEPLVVYHGTDASFDTFQIDYESYNGFKDGAYFTSNKKFAKGYTVKNNIMPVFLSIKDPLEFDGNGVAWNEISFKEVSKILNIDEDTLRSVVRPKYQPTLLQSIKEIFGKNKDSKYAFYNANALIKLARLLNKDGAYLQHLTDSGKTFLGTFKKFNADQIVVLDPNQIKSIDNQGTFSTQDNNIYLADSNSENISQLESMQSYSNSKELLDNMDSEMATVLRDVANKINMQPVSIEYTDRPLNEIYPEATYWTPAIYDRNTNKIVVNTTGDFSRYGSLENVLLHEIAHAITLDSLAADTEAANELRAIQKEYAATHEDHASKNVYEFAAELFSNPEVIHNMQDFPAPTGKKTILQKLMDWFKRLFGKNTTHENLINKIVENVIEYNAYQTLEHNENTDDYIPLALPAASKREEIAATKLMSTFDSIVKTLEIRTQSMQYNPIDDSFDRRETVRNTSVFNRLYNLSNTVKNITDPNSMLDVLNGSIEYMNSVIDSLAEAEKVLDNINEKIENAKTMGDEATTNKYRVALDNFGAEYLYPHEANLNNLYETVFSQEFNDAIYESLLGTNVFNDIRQTLNALRAEFSSIKMDSRNNIGWKYKNTVIRTLTNFLKGEMEEANDPRIESALMNWLSFDSDISAYHKYAGLPNSTNNVVISSVRKVIGDVNNEVHKKVYHKYAELMGLAAATRDHLLLFERNSKGKKTGYIIRDRKYGEYQNDKYNWRKKWLKDHKLASVDELKLDQNLWLEYQRAYNDWKSKHAERKYTPEFYDIFANLSIEANQALSEVNIDIDNLLKPYLDNVTKKPRFENMSQDDYDKYQRLLEKKRNLANPYDALTGEIKPEDSVEYKIAMELTEAYEKLRKGLKSKANMAAFMAEMEKMREIEGYTPDGRYTLYEAWLERNTRWEYTPEFEALVSKQNKKDYGEIYDRLYQARTNLLKLYRTDRYEVDYVRMPQEVKEKIRELDIAMYRIRRKSGKLGGGRRLFKSELSDIAKDNGGKDAVSPDDIWVDDKGVKHYFSYMTTVKPINDKYMHRVPNNNWAETSEESAFYNPNYDPTIPEAEQPKLELYDNRKDYNAVMRNTNLSKLRQALIDTIGETNAKLTHTNYRNDYKLPQIPGTIWNYISGKGLVTGVRDYMLDAFAITPDDELHGVKNKVRPNGTEINIMPTQYTTMLADPSVGTNDLVGAVMRYYRMGCNYEAKKKVAPQLNLLDETIKREGKVVKSQNTVSAANSNLSNVIHKYISYHLYGRRTALPEITIGNSRISLDKIFRHFATWGRDIGLSWNLRSAISGGVSAWSFYAADAYINRHMNVRDFTLGNAELAKELLTLKTLRQLGKNMGDSDLVSMLEYNGLSFNQEEDMANTNRWRVGRMITRTIEPYSAFKLMSFLPNSVFMRGIYNNYRLLELEDGNKHFISENDFLYNHFPEQSIEEKRAIYNSTKTTLWSAYDKKGGVKIKPEYKKYVTKELENEISDKLGNISSHAEGMVETADKSGVHLHTALSTILMFRAFLPKNIENTWNPAYWNYQTKELAIGTAMAYWYGWLYGANNWGIKAIRALTFRNKERDISELSDKFNVSESYTRKQIETYAKRFNAQVFTYIFWLTLFNALGMIGSTGPDDDYWYQNILMLELKKISLESGSRYNVMDIADIFNSVSPLLQTVEDIGTAFGPWSYFKERKYKKIKKGAFKGLYGWQRDFIKVIPWLNAYYNMKNPGEKLRDLQNRIGG